jgi:hypothetical protein
MNPIIIAAIFVIGIGCLWFAYEFQRGQGLQPIAKAAAKRTFKSFLLPIATCLACLSIGVWIGNWRAYINKQRDFDVREYVQIQKQIKVIELLHINENVKAVQDLEQDLDFFVLFFGSNRNRPNLTPDEWKILRMIAKHRIEHPFSNQAHPDYDQRVRTTLQGL